MWTNWRKAKQALGSNLCYYIVPRTSDDDDSFSAPATPSRPGSTETTWRKRSKSSSTPSQKTCSICLGTMKPGKGHAIFTAECSHSFHFHCITSNIKHGNQLCPVCRSKWTEIPLQSPRIDPGPVKARRGQDPSGWPLNDDIMTAIPRLPPSRPNNPYRHAAAPQFQGTEPGIFYDDEPLNQADFAKMNASKSPPPPSNAIRTIDMRTYPEVSPIPRKNSLDDFTVLIHLTALVTDAVTRRHLPYISRASRTPVDLLTVLDISGSMAGTKLALLKRAMSFVIHNLGPRDRLSVVAFSSTARRLFPLRRMTEPGRQQALQAVNLLVANGGTNIAEALRKGAKVMEERREKNPVASIILLSDGQDTFTAKSSGGDQFRSLLPSSIQGDDGSGFRIPVHTFGFGADHDASSMHSISETSGGTFSFIETESAIQDAFAQCIGGILSVVVQQLQVGIECAHPGLRIHAVKAGSYPSRMKADRRTGYIDVGDLYADEERDFLIHVNVPTEHSSNETSLLKLRCTFKDPITKEKVMLEGEEVKVARPETVEQQVVSLEVDRHRNRLHAAEAMSQARAAAERGDLGHAVSILEDCREMLSRTVSAKCQDRLGFSLDAELREMQERMRSRQVYESSGRAYILSGLSSHSWQRATARGDYTDISSDSYRTPSMVEMLTRSQTFFVASPSTTTTERLVHPSLSFFPSPKPR